MAAHFDAVMLWLSENMFWLSLTGAFLFGATVALWIYVGIQPSRPAELDDRKKRRLSILEANLLEAFKGLGLAIGSNMPIQYKLALAQAEPILLDLERLNAVPIPKNAEDDDRLKCLRAIVYLTEMKPMLQRDDLPGIRERAEEIVPRINAMTVDELNGLFEHGENHGRY